MYKEELKVTQEKKRIGSNFLGILNDLKRRPEDAARELELSLDYINGIIEGKNELTSEIVTKATKVWPVNARDFYVMHDDCETGVKLMRREESEKSSRIMNRAGKPYYEYRDTAMSSVGPFRPEWIEELCIVGDNDPNNPDVQWNNGHFMHQFTYFIGNVNFYYIGQDGEKKIAIMNTGDSNYITPFTPHSFATRRDAKTNGLILALTYGNNLTGDIQQELSALGIESGSEFATDFSTKEKATQSLLKIHMENATIDIEELSKRTGIHVERLDSFLIKGTIPTASEFVEIAKSLNINVRDLLPPDKITEKVIVHYHHNARCWEYPKSKAYRITELASTPLLPFSKAIEIDVLKEDDNNFDLKVGLHQYGYNVGNSEFKLSWKINDSIHSEIIRPNDSFYIKPFVLHSFRGKGKALILRIGGKVSGDPQRELSIIGKKNTHRAINETIQWFDIKGKN